jgi:hypothetical protein
MDILNQITTMDISALLLAALMCNLGVLGARQLLTTLKKMRNQSKIIAGEFDMTKPMTLFNVITAVICAVAATYITFKEGAVVWLATYSFMVFLTSFVTWKVGIKDTVDLIPAALKAAKRKLNSIKAEAKDSVD